MYCNKNMSRVLKKKIIKLIQKIQNLKKETDKYEVAGHPFLAIEGGWAIPRP